ncbi:MAG: YbaB/EbfC family nucleoid-associated protein [Desulfocapsaceae bacterium]|nr:YbaB/EbfC family nucleoid-associated protein [Desulfocapsaceae bacterium]
MDIGNIMQHAQQMQAKLIQIQQELGKKTVQGSAGGGMVTVTVNGRGEVLAIAIEKEMITLKDAGMMQDLLVAATNDGLRRARELKGQAMGKLTGGMNIPGLTDLF